MVNVDVPPRPKAPSGVVRDIFRDFRADPDPVADRVFAELFRRIPLAAELPVEVVADVRAKMNETLGLALDHLAMDTPLGELTERVRAVAVDRAAVGIPLEVTILAHEIAADVLTDLSFERLALDGVVDTVALGDAMRRGMRLLQAATMGVAAGYEQVAVAAALSRQHEQQALVEALYAGREVTTEALARVQRAGVDVRFQWAAATKAAALPATKAAAGAAANAGAGEPSVLWLRQRDPAALTGELAGWAVQLSAQEPEKLPAGSGVARVDATGPGTALRRAIRAAEVAGHLGAQQWAGDVAAPFAALLATPAADREAFLQATLGALANDDELLATLVSYLTSGLQRTASARALHVHRHTLDRRLARIDQLLPVDLGDSSARLRVQIALFFLGLFPAGGSD